MPFALALSPFVKTAMGFKYLRATSLGQAAQLLRADPDAKLLAGGQSLLAAIKLGLTAPTQLIDLQDISPLLSITIEQEQLHIGAMVTHASIACSALVKQFCPMLAQLAQGIADQQVRNRGTIGGSISNHDPAACWPAGLLAVNAVIQTDRRQIPGDEFFTGLFSTALEPDEIVCSIKITRPRRASYIKFEQPASRFAIVGVAVAQLADQTARVAVTGLGMGVTRFKEAEEALAAQFSIAALTHIKYATDHVTSDIHANAEYRSHLASVLTRRATAKLINL
jgi:aerobic carbon-monoxide dehydrogenase medium subunit